MRAERLIQVAMQPLILEDPMFLFPLLGKKKSGPSSLQSLNTFLRKVEWSSTTISASANSSRKYIEIREVGGSPIAIIIGKQPMAFGQNVQAMPFFENNPLADLQEIKEVYGITVDLTEGLFGIFDQAEVSVFETGKGDLELGKVDGVSIRLSKMITDQWLVTLSHADLGNDGQSTGRERRTSVGLIGETSDGTLVGWVEGMYFSNSPEYQNSNFAITVGGMMRVHETTDIIVEYNWVEKELQEIGVGVRTALTSNLSIGAEVRYRNYVERDNEVVFGIMLTYTFGNSDYSGNENYLFGGKDEEDFEDED